MVAAGPLAPATTSGWSRTAAGRSSPTGLCWLEAPPDGGGGRAARRPRPQRARAGRAPARPVRGAGGRAGAAAAAPADGVTLDVWAHESDARRLELLERRGYRPRARVPPARARPRRQPRARRRGPPGSGSPRSAPASTTPRSTRPTRTRSPTTTGPVRPTWRSGCSPASPTAARTSACGSSPGTATRWWAASRPPETPSGAYMGDLFVRRPWRGRGIAGR